MKKIVNVATPAVCAVALILSVTAISKTNAATAPAPIVTSATAAPAGQPVDLTYAAEKALPSVVYIKSVQNSKVQTVEYSDPFEDFFSDPFGGFFGRRVRAMAVAVSVRYRLQSVLPLVRVLSSRLMVIS